MSRKTSVSQSRAKKDTRPECPACAGEGRVCCVTWAEVRAQAGEDLVYSEVGVPLWPLSANLEMPRCPFCGRAFKSVRAERSSKASRKAQRGVGPR